MKACMDLIVKVDIVVYIMKLLHKGAGKLSTIFKDSFRTAGKNGNFNRVGTLIGK